MIVGNSLPQIASAVSGGELKPPKDKISVPESTADIHLDWSGGYKHHLEFAERRDIVHRAVPMNQAGFALKTMDEHLEKLERFIGNVRPSLADSDWDFTVKDGKLKVTGSMSDDDRKWLEGVVNNNEELKAAAKSYVSAAVAYLETNEENPVYSGQNSFTGRIDLFNFKDVEKQIGQVFGFKSTIRDIQDSHRDPSTGRSTHPLEMLAGDSFALIASRLKTHLIVA